MECLLPYIGMVTVPHIMVGLERMLDYRGVRLERFHCICNSIACTVCASSLRVGWVLQGVEADDSLG